VTVIGAAELGSASARAISGGPAAEVVLIDIEPGLARAEGADIGLAGFLAGAGAEVSAGTSYELAGGSSVCVLACGHAPAPGVDPTETAAGNSASVAAASAALATHCPDAVLVVAAEPNEVCCHVALAASEFPRARVLGAGGVVASAALRLAIAHEVGAWQGDVAAMVLGAHGADCVPLLELASVAGAPLQALVPADRLEAIERETRDADRAEARAALPLATAAAVAAIVEAVLTDSRRVLPCTALCRGDYGVDNAFLSVPCSLGEDGIAEIVALPLAEQRLGALQASAQSVKDALAKLR
jgi:malate dehydrogenase